MRPKEAENDLDRQKEVSKIDLLEIYEERLTIKHEILKDRIDELCFEIEEDKNTQRM